MIKTENNELINRNSVLHSEKQTASLNDKSQKTYYENSQQKT